jgi:hypothetical protein
MAARHCVRPNGGRRQTFVAENKQKKAKKLTLLVEHYRMRTSPTERSGREVRQSSLQRVCWGGLVAVVDSRLVLSTLHQASPAACPTGTQGSLANEPDSPVTQARSHGVFPIDQPRLLAYEPYSPSGTRPRGSRRNKFCAI